MAVQNVEIGAENYYQPTYFEDDARGWRTYKICDLTTSSQAKYLAEECKSGANLEILKAVGIVALGAALTVALFVSVCAIAYFSFISFAVLAAPLAEISASLYLSVVVADFWGTCIGGGILAGFLLGPLWENYAVWFNDKCAYANHLDDQATRLMLTAFEIEAEENS